MTEVLEYPPARARKIAPRKIDQRSEAVNRMFAAAVVSRQFRELLLKNPREALKQGYLGETFDLTRQEKALILSIRAGSLSELAKQMYPELND